MKLKITKRNHAVSEVLGTILLLLISVMIFSVVYLSFFSVDVKPSTPTVNLAGSIKENNLILEHCGGEPLSLDTEVSIILQDGTNTKLEIKDDDGQQPPNYYLPSPGRDNNKWDIGERFTYDLQDLSNYQIYNPIEVNVVDVESNSLIMSGTFQAKKETDLEVNLLTSDYNPAPGDSITISMKVTNNGPCMAEDVKVDFGIPTDGLTFDADTDIAIPVGTYSYMTGPFYMKLTWDIPSINDGETLTLTLDADVNNPTGSFGYTQLGIILDGSDSIQTDEWEMMLEGVADAIRDDAMPHDGNIELTVIQMACSYPNVIPRQYCRPEIVRRVITDDPADPGYYLDVADEIENIQKIGGYSPLPLALKVATDEIATSANIYPEYDPSHIQIIDIITDGYPNLKIYSKFPPYQDCVEVNGETICAINEDTNYMDVEYAPSQVDVSYYRDLIINTLQLDEDQDQINALAVDGSHGCNVEYLKNEVVWPEPGYEWTGTNPDGSGWVRYTDTKTLIEDSILYQINYQMDALGFKARIIHMNIPDTNELNNGAALVITPSN